jgi:hypothetical protein
LAPIAVVTLLALGLRLYRIDAQSLWYDEGISAHQLTRSFGEIVSAAAQDTHPPLYYWTLKAWGSVFGASEIGLRSLSACWGVAAVALTGLIGRRLFGPRAAWLAALLLACSPLAVYYSQEVRMYAQVTALGLLAAWAYVRRDWLLYILAAVGTLYSQYLGVAFLLALNLHAAFALRGRPLLVWLGSNCIVAIAFLPWLPVFVAQQAHDLNVSPRTPATLGSQTLSAYGGGLASGDLSLWGGGLLIALALAGWSASSLRARSPHPPAAVAAAGLSLLLWLVPLGLVLALGLRSGLFELRYLDLGLPGVCLLAGAAIARARLLAPVLAVVALVPAAAGLQRQYFDPTLFRDDYRGVAQAIAIQAQPSDAIVLSAPNQAEVFSFYYQGPLTVVGLPAQRPADPTDTRQRLEALRAEHPRLWLVEWAMNEADPRGIIATWLAQNGFQAGHAWYGSLQLALVAFASADEATERVDAALDNGVLLEGFRVPAGPLGPGDTLPITLLWRVQRAPGDARWKVFTHLLDAQQRVVAQRDSEPVDGLEPTNSWQAGQSVEDHYGIPLPADLPAGTYDVEIGMYLGDHRATFVGGGDHLVLRTMTVSR